MSRRPTTVVSSRYEDVTERLRLEGELRHTRGSLAAAKTQAERAMREAQMANAWLRDAFEAIPVGLVLCDAQDRFVLWNKRYMKSRVNPHIEVGMRYGDSLRESVSRGPFSRRSGARKNG